MYSDEQIEAACEAYAAAEGWRWSGRKENPTAFSAMRAVLATLPEQVSPADELPTRAAIAGALLNAYRGPYDSLALDTLGNGAREGWGAAADYVLSLLARRPATDEAEALRKRVAELEAVLDRGVYTTTGVIDWRATAMKDSDALYAHKARIVSLEAQLASVTRDHAADKEQLAKYAQALIDCQRLLGTPLNESPGERNNWDPRTHYEQWSALVDGNSRLERERDEARGESQHYQAELNECQDALERMQNERNEALAQTLASVAAWQDASDCETPQDLEGEMTRLAYEADYTREQHDETLAKLAKAGELEEARLRVQRDEIDRLREQLAARPAPVVIDEALANPCATLSPIVMAIDDSRGATPENRARILRDHIRVLLSASVSVPQGEQVHRYEPAQVEGQLATIADLRRDLDTARRDAKGARVERDQLRADLEKTRAELEACKSELDVVRQEYDLLTRDYDSADADRASLRAGVAEVRAWADHHRHRDPPDGTKQHGYVDAAADVYRQLCALLKPAPTWQHTSSDGDSHTFVHETGATRTLEGFATWQEAARYLDELAPAEAGPVSDHESWTKAMFPKAYQEPVQRPPHESTKDRSESRLADLARKCGPLPCSMLAVGTKPPHEPTTVEDLPHDRHVERDVAALTERVERLEHDNALLWKFVEGLTRPWVVGPAIDGIAHCAKQALDERKYST